MEEEARFSVDMAKEKMEKAFTLKVPLTVDVNAGMSWYDTK